jgi:transcriptional regulator with GAF, ATPase, and Fis domain
LSTVATTASMNVYEGPGVGDLVAGLVVLYGATSTPLPSVYLLRPADAERGRELIIGREPGVAVCLDVNAVSRRHASLRCDQGQWWISDLKSRNGTIVEGAFVTEAALEQNVEVRIGDVIFKFVETGAELFFGYRCDGTMDPGAARASREATTLLGGAQMDRIVASLEKIAPTMLSVIVRGESGTGKEVAAREIHRLSGRKGAFVAVNCAAIPATLLESELFGYRKGAFSGADRDKIGLIKAAHNGTLFLDEIGDMPLEAQAKLLRVLQSREVMPVGATSAEPVDVRIVCATHRDLVTRQAGGQFRGDLYARLNEYAVTLPPLRDRKEDIYLLSTAFLTRQGRPELQLSFGFLVGLLHYDWPFNVRELEACLKRAVALTTTTSLEVAQLPDPLREAMANYGRREVSGPSRPPEFSHEPSAPLAGLAATAGSAPAGWSPGGGLPRGATPTEPELRALLAAHRGNVAAVGRALGKERMQIHRWMKRYNIEISDYRQG